MNYKTYNPNVDLSAFVKCYWTLDAPKEIKHEKRGTYMDIGSEGKETKEQYL